MVTLFMYTHTHTNSHTHLDQTLKSLLCHFWNYMLTTALFWLVICILIIIIIKRI